MTEGKVQSINVNQAEDIWGFIERAKKVFGLDKEFAFAEWPDGSLRLVMQKESTNG